jgi:predicted DNA binding CopG/RHH family protein
MKKLDRDEQNIINSYEKEEWKSISELEAQKQHYREIAKNTYVKNKRINIRISEKIINELKARSLEEGIPYQTLITSILHKFTTGKLVEKS